MVAGKQGNSVTSPCPARIAHMHCTVTVGHGKHEREGNMHTGLSIVARSPAARSRVSSRLVHWLIEFSMRKRESDATSMHVVSYLMRELR